mmetsp:Transcript_30853/g.67501  ORF Transcript_30853/g.67501 Transcript_30853/m.67501 type:complete len:209 (+) Transcript_30853:684-1310(+)
MKVAPFHDIQLATVWPLPWTKRPECRPGAASEGQVFKLHNQQHVLPALLGLQPHTLSEIRKFNQCTKMVQGSSIVRVWRQTPGTDHGVIICHFHDALVDGFFLRNVICGTLRAIHRLAVKDLVAARHDAGPRSVKLKAVKEGVALANGVQVVGARGCSQHLWCSHSWYAALQANTGRHCCCSRDGHAQHLDKAHASWARLLAGFIMAF